jgi:hypothetical protein
MMKKSLILAVSSVLLTTVLAVTAHIEVETRQGKTHQVRISYVPPKNPAHQQVYELLKERQSLE